MSFPILICPFSHCVTNRLVPETHFVYNPVFVVHQYLIVGCADISNRTVICIAGMPTSSTLLEGKNVTCRVWGDNAGGFKLSVYCCTPLNVPRPCYLTQNACFSQSSSLPLPEGRRWLDEYRRCCGERIDVRVRLLRGEIAGLLSVFAALVLRRR